MGAIDLFPLILKSITDYIVGLSKQIETTIDIACR